MAGKGRNMVCPTLILATHHPSRHKLYNLGPKPNLSERSSPELRSKWSKPSLVNGFAINISRGDEANGVLESQVGFQCWRFNSKAEVEEDDRGQKS